MLVPTPEDRLCDDHGRPYFLWDCDVTLPVVRGYLSSDDEERRVYWIAKIMRQAKPDDALVLVAISEMRRLWSRLGPMLGRSRAFWEWYLAWAR